MLKPRSQMTTNNPTIIGLIGFPDVTSVNVITSAGRKHAALHPCCKMKLGSTPFQGHHLMSTILLVRS